MFKDIFQKEENAKLNEAFLSFVSAKQNDAHVHARYFHVNWTKPLIISIVVATEVSS